MARVLTEYNGKMGIWVRKKGGYAIFIPEDEIDVTKMPKDMANAIKSARTLKKSYDLREKLDKEYEDAKKSNYNKEHDFEHEKYTKDVWDNEDKLNEVSSEFRKLRKDNELKELDAYFKYRKADVEYNYNRNEFGQVNWHGKDRRLFSKEKYSLKTGKELETKHGHKIQVTEHSINSIGGQTFVGRNKDGVELSYYYTPYDDFKVTTSFGGTKMKVIDNYLKRIKKGK